MLRASGTVRQSNGFSAGRAPPGRPRPSKEAGIATKKEIMRRLLKWLSVSTIICPDSQSVWDTFTTGKSPASRFRYDDRISACRSPWLSPSKVRGCGHFFGPATPPVPGSSGTASGSSSPAPPSAVPRCSISGTSRACGRTRGWRRPTSRDGGRTRS